MRPRLRPIDLYTDVFGTMMPGSVDAEALKKALLAKKSVLDFSLLRAGADAARWVLAAPKDLIEAHELAIRDLENEIGGPARQQQRPGGVRHRDAAALHLDRRRGQQPRLLQLEADRVGQRAAPANRRAASGRAARRATLRLDAGRVVPVLARHQPHRLRRPVAGQLKAIYMHHPVSHDVNDGNIDGNDSGKQSQIEFLLRVEEWYAAQTAGFINTLKTTLDIYGQPLLDSTIVPYVTEVGRRHSPPRRSAGRDLRRQGARRAGRKSSSRPRAACTTT